MVKTVVAVIVGLVLLNTAWFVLKIAILIVAERREYEKYRSMDEVMGAFTEAMKTAGFGEEAEETPKNSGKKTKAATE